MAKAYEVHNPSFNDMNLDQQIDAGCNDWCAESPLDSHQYFGRTAAEAETIRTTCDANRRSKISSRKARFLAERCVRA